MDYRVNFSGGIREGQTDIFPKKIGGYVRLKYEDGTVEVYNRIPESDTEDGATYALHN